ncbi:MAG: potassium channel family protein [Planctomycetota bacterium]|jgi:voltage-gated potassium channel
MTKKLSEYALVARVMAVLLCLQLLATLAFMLVEGWSFMDALYMSVITLTTVGYEEVHPLSAGGRVIVLVYLAVGLGVFLFGIALIGQFLVHIRLTDLRGRRKMEKTVRSLKNHLVVCGYGRMGTTLCQQLASSREKFVVIDKDADLIDAALEEGQLAIHGDATEDSVLRTAGIETARGLAAVLPSDADNLFIVVSARLLNPKLMVLSRASDERTAKKLEKAGADRVVSLYQAGGLKMAQMLTNPNLEDFMQILTDQGRSLELAEIIVPEAAGFCGKSVGETDFRKQGVLIVAHNKPGGRVIVPPQPDLTIDAGDTLFAFGAGESIEKMIRLCEPAAARTPSAS